MGILSEKFIRARRESFTFSLPADMDRIPVTDNSIRTMVPDALTITYEASIRRHSDEKWVFAALHLTGHNGQKPSTMGRFLSVHALAVTHPVLADEVREHIRSFLEKKDHA